ncbi:MAG: 16S rRNA (cytidine(1402)-2'-O)-methyltransferase [Dehalococcoidia bacterium]|nr:16S rRNA (cytidine(1402)-2'-O)-methyltransferase [Dehalococcoidia bacterium]
MPTLYLVATPIGNLEDITLRALRVLKEVGLIAAEDTRTTRKLLAAHGISTKVTSYYEGNKDRKTPQLLQALERHDLAIVSEAGTPGLSDPGYELVQAAIERGITVVPVPGASAVVAALVVSGLPTDQFVYLGFLPRKAGERRRLLEEVAQVRRTLVAFEAPHRVRRAFQDMAAILGDRRIAVCRELTKVYEEMFRGSVSEALDHFNEPRGEFTLVVEGAHPSPPSAGDEEVQRQLMALRKAGVPPGRAVSQVAKILGVDRARVYQAWVELAGSTPKARRKSPPRLSA